MSTEIEERTQAENKIFFIEIQIEISKSDKQRTTNSDVDCNENMFY